MWRWASLTTMAKRAMKRARRFEQEQERRLLGSHGRDPKERGERKHRERK